MDKLLIQTSRTGDLVNLIPICYAAHLKGEKYGILTTKEFGSVLDGCSYIEKIELDIKPWELGKAIEEAKKICPNICVTQTNAAASDIQKYAYEPAGQKNAVTDSFCREAFKLAGCIKEWGKIPLVFDRRSPEREALLMPANWDKKWKKKRIMLVSPGSFSSPFQYRELLLTLLRLKYPTWNIIDLSEVRSERFYDLLGLYEAAHCLVTVDTGHLHLAYAVPTLPVMAIIQDKPLSWHGSAWRPSHHFHCRYRDFPRRALELFTAIDDIGKQPQSNIIQVYHGSVRKNNGVFYFPIQPGSCQRDSANALGDKERFPMLRESIKMIMQVARPDSFIVLTREDVRVQCAFQNDPCYAWRMNRNKDGNDTFFPAIDLLAAPVDFWVKVFPLIPDIVLGADAFWSRIVMEIFKAHGAKEIDGIYRNEI